MFISSLICLIFQPDLGAIIALWEIALAVSFLIIVALALYARIWQIGLPIKSYLFLCFDLFFIMTAFCLMFTSAISSGYELKNPLGIGATFRYELILPFLILVSSLLVAKDFINL